MADGRQRVDQWLWHARFTKSRTLAQKLVSDGNIRVNRRKIEYPAHMIGTGDVLTIGVDGRVFVCEVLSTSLRRGPFSQARLLYRVIAGDFPQKPPGPGLGGPAGPGAEKHGANHEIDETKHS